MSSTKGHESRTEIINGAHWFVLDQTGELGPLSWDSILFKMETGELSTQALVWTEGLPDWTSLGTTLEQQRRSASKKALDSGTGFTPTSLRPLGSSLKQDPWKKHVLHYFNRFRFPIAIFTAMISILAIRVLPEYSRLNALESALTHDDFREVRAFLLEPKAVSSPPLISIAKENPLNPVLYFFSKDPDQTQVRIRIVGIRGSLLNRSHYDQTQTVRLSHQMATTIPFTDFDHRPLSRGIYTITASLQDEKNPIVKRSYFIGGPRDAAFDSELISYNQKLAEQRSAEEIELRQYLSTLETQLSDTNQHFHEAIGAIQSNSKSGAQTWNRHSLEWAAIQNQLVSVFDSWTDSIIDRDFFYYELFTQLKTLEHELRSLHHEQVSFISTGSESTFSEGRKNVTRIFDLESELQGKIMDLRNKIKQVSTI